MFSELLFWSIFGTFGSSLGVFGTLFWDMLMSRRVVGACLGVFWACLGLWDGFWWLYGPFLLSWGLLFGQLWGSENHEKPMIRLCKTMIFMILMGSDFGGFKSVSGELNNHKSRCQGASQGYLSGILIEDSSNLRYLQSRTAGLQGLEDCKDCKDWRTGANYFTRRWPEARRFF